MKQKWLFAVWKFVKSIKIKQNVSYRNIPGEQKKNIKDAWIRVIARTVSLKVETLTQEGNYRQLSKKVSCKIRWKSQNIFSARGACI